MIQNIDSDGSGDLQGFPPKSSFFLKVSKYILYNQKIESDIALDIFGVKKAEFDDPDITVTLQQSYKPPPKKQKKFTK